MLSVLKKKQKIEPQVIYGDKNLLVLNKPENWVSLRVKTYNQQTLQDWIEKKFQIKIGGRGGIVHRLDKETWGLILAAKNQRTFENLQKQFKKREVKKKYWALVRGRLLGSGKIVVPLGRLGHNKFKFGPKPEGKKTETQYQVMENFRSDRGEFSLVEVEPKTGRTHQIRAHFCYLGHPIFGDPLYGEKRDQGEPMFLVAKEIEFFDPEKREKVKFSIPLPNALKSIISEIK